MKRWMAAAAALTLMTTGACGNDDGRGGDDRLTAVTYNLGLARGYVDYADERAPETISALAATDADVVCVQEVWYPEHVEALTQATAGTWAHAQFLEPDPGEASGEPACGDTELDPLEACVEVECVDVPVDQLSGCVLTQCGTEFAALAPACQGCLASNVGASLETIRLTCTTGGAGGYAYGGAFGIGLLTDLPVVQQDHLVFESTYNRRAVLHARVNDPDLGEVEVFCTHLTAIFSDVPYPKETGSWAEEQAAQIDAMLGWMDQHSAGDVRMVLGDFNTGPAVGPAVADHPENYDKFIQAGYVSAYAGQPDAQCSFCGENPLVGGGDGVLIDHVFLDSGLEAVSAERLFTGPLEIQVDGEAVTTAYSDHYGVAAVVQRPAE